MGRKLTVLVSLEQTWAILSFTIFLFFHHKKIIEIFILEKIIENILLIENIISFAIPF